MLDIKFVRENPEAVKENIKKRHRLRDLRIAASLLLLTNLMKVLRVPSVL